MTMIPGTDIVSGPEVRKDAPAADDWGVVVRVVGGVVVVGPITADQGAPNIDANSWPVHQVGALPAGTNVIGQVTFPTGTLANGTETPVGAAAVSILAANANRKTAIIQNTGVANIRVGVTGVTATTGFRLQPNESIIYDMPFVPTQAIFAIREGAISSTAFAQEIT